MASIGLLLGGCESPERARIAETEDVVVDLEPGNTETFVLTVSADGPHIDVAEIGARVIKTGEGYDDENAPLVPTRTASNLLVELYCADFDDPESGTTETRDLGAGEHPSLSLATRDFRVPFAVECDVTFHLDEDAAPEETSWRGFGAFLYYSRRDIDISAELDQPAGRE